MGHYDSCYEHDADIERTRQKKLLADEWDASTKKLFSSDLTPEEKLVVFAVMKAKRKGLL